jgi:superoxide dismutase, Cu-Zn family
MSRISTFVARGLVAAGLLGFGGFGAAASAADATAVAHVANASGHKEKITGTVTFTAVEGGVKVVADIDGLTPGKHGFHIHQKADLSAPDLTSAGPHFDAGGKHKHGGPESAEHHAGDLGNITADDKGHAHLEGVFKGLTIEGETGVVGHSVIVHAKEDDLKDIKSAGARIAGGAIEEEKK